MKEDNTKITISESKREVGGEGVNTVKAPERGVYIELEEENNTSTELLDRTTIETEDPAIEKEDQITRIEEENNNNNKLYPPSQDAFTPFTYSPSSTADDNRKKLFNNPLISESDLSIGGPYDPKIINNISRFELTDRWFCTNCTMKGDKWFMMKHPCNNNKK